MAIANDGAVPFEIRAEWNSARRLCLWLAGDIDQDERDLIIAELDGATAPAEIYLEMSRVTFLASAGLSALIHACRMLEAVDERVVLVNPSATVVKLLDVCRITQQFEIHLDGAFGAESASGPAPSTDPAEPPARHDSRDGGLELTRWP